MTSLRLQLDVTSLGLRLDVVTSPRLLLDAVTLKLQGMRVSLRLKLTICSLTSNLEVTRAFEAPRFEHLELSSLTWGADMGGADSESPPSGLCRFSFTG